MKRITIDGQEFEVPVDDLTGNGLRETADIPEDDVLYRVRDDRHEVVNEDGSVEVEDGDQFGTLPRFISGAREGAR